MTKSARTTAVCLALTLFATVIATAADSPGQFFTHDGVKFYYEVHGSGQPLLLVHGNGGSTADFKAQIPYFRKRYRVIAMDSRDQGRSSAAPTLILASDHDVIRDEHTVAIYRHIPNAQLVIFPNATHMVPFDEPAAFNAAVDRFFRIPFVKKDRVTDMFKSLERLRAPQGTK
jgi:pimeloyl-ACP methyl ester carboxylesterase